MKRLSSFIALLLFIASAAHPASLHAQDTVREALEKRYQIMDEGLQHRDVHRYLSVAVDDLVTVDDDKTFATRKQFEGHLSKDIGSFQHIYTFTSHIDKLEVIGDFARTAVTSSFDGARPDKKNPALTHRYVMQLKFMHEWRKIGVQWRLTRLVELGETGTIDGNLIEQDHK